MNSVRVLLLKNMLDRKIYNNFSMKISIIIPVFKVEKYLHECVDSVLKQTYKNIEIILVDDGSPDRCPEICDEYAIANDNVIVIHKPNGGLSDARNAGFKKATGRYVVFLDSDDWWEGNNSLEKAVEILNTAPDILFFDRITYCDNGSVIKPKGMLLSTINNMNYEEAISSLMKAGKFIPSACNKFVKTSLLRDHQIEFEKGLISEDIEWTYQIMQHVRNVKGFDIPFYGYRRREGSITHNLKPKTINDLLYVIEKWSYRVKDSKMSDNLKFQLLGYLNYQYCIANGQVCRITKEVREKFEDRFDALSWLLKYDINKKTHLVLMISRIGGLKNIRKILRFYIWIKNKGFKIQ